MTEKMKISPEKPLPNVTKIILESISDGVFTVDHNWRIMSFNRAAEEITGISRKEAVGRHCWEVFRSNMCEGDCALKRTMKEGTALTNISTYIVNSDKKRIPIAVSTALLKDENGDVLGGVETFRDLSLVEELRRELDARFEIGNMTSRSATMQKLFHILPQVADSDSSILIEGETGTGKELMARAIHDLSRRKDKPFVAVNCGALPDSLLESELFGYKAGAFTHALKDKPGLFSQAEGGTLLLDEIGDVSPAFQVRLLRVLEAREYQPLGAVTPVKTNVRILAATNKNLEKMVAEGTFRQDLFYRIHVVRLLLPPLRERKEDIPLLVERFIARFNRIRGRTVTGVSPEVMAILMAYHYPGNIRELENMIEHAFVLCPDGLLTPKHLPSGLMGSPIAPLDTDSREDILKTAEKQMMMAALERNHFNRLAAARELGMHKSTFFRKVKRLGILLPRVDGRTELGLNPKE
ncbi:MAG: sigma 54-interacting transcriptional regulator [Desulfobacterales bacterium]|nr:sigma 54-interacting transcriptional regulator [Desulfobacterales bacterium]